MAKTHNLQYHVTMIEELKSHLTHHLDLIYIHANTAAHIRIVLIVAVHYAVKQGGKSSVKTLLNTLTPEQQLQFLSTKDKKDESGKTAVQWAPADERKEIDKLLRQYMREADFEVNYGRCALFSLLEGLKSGNGASLVFQIDFYDGIFDDIGAKTYIMRTHNCVFIFVGFVLSY